MAYIGMLRHQNRRIWDLTAAQTPTIHGRSHVMQPPQVATFSTAASFFFTLRVTPDFHRKPLNKFVHHPPRAMSQSGSPLSLQLGPQRRPRFNLARFRTPYSPGSSPRNINLLTTSGLQTAHPSDQPSPPLVSMLDPTLSPPNPLAEDTQDLTAFINSVADDLAFSGDERQQLHDLALVSDLKATHTTSPPLISLTQMPMSYQMVSLMASSLWLQAAHEKIATELEDIKKGLQEVAEHLHNDFRLTTSQKVCVVTIMYMVRAHFGP